MSAAPTTKVPAHVTIKLGHVTIKLDRETTWKVNCDGCKRRRSGPFRVLLYGITAAEFCQECFDELRAGVAAQ